MHPVRAPLRCNSTSHIRRIASLHPRKSARATVPHHLQTRKMRAVPIIQVKLRIWIRVEVVLTWWLEITTPERRRARIGQASGPVRQQFLVKQGDSSRINNRSESTQLVRQLVLSLASPRWPTASLTKSRIRISNHPPSSNPCINQSWTISYTRIAIRHWIQPSSNKCKICKTFSQWTWVSLQISLARTETRTRCSASSLSPRSHLLQEVGRKQGRSRQQGINCKHYLYNFKNFKTLLILIWLFR